MENILEKSIELYEQGYKGKEVSNITGINWATLYYHLRKLGKSRKKGTGRIISEEVKHKMSEQKIGNKNPNFGKYEEWMQKGLEIGRSKEVRKKAAINISKAIKKCWENGVYDSNNYGGNAKIYNIEGRICKGKNERDYVLKFKEEFPCVLNKANSIKTEYGIYTPDFDFGDFFIELKSTHTYDVLYGLFDYKKKNIGSLKQLNKINWVNKNIKPIKIVINYKNQYYSEEEYKKIRHDNS